MVLKSTFVMPSRSAAARIISRSIPVSRPASTTLNGAYSETPPTRRKRAPLRRSANDGSTFCPYAVIITHYLTAPTEPHQAFQRGLPRGHKALLGRIARELADTARSTAQPHAAQSCAGGGGSVKDGTGLGSAASRTAGEPSGGAALTLVPSLVPGRVASRNVSEDMRWRIVTQTMRIREPLGRRRLRLPQR